MACANPMARFPHGLSLLPAAIAGCRSCRGGQDLRWSGCSFRGLPECAAIQGQDVLVVGAGNSGTEIAVDLAEGAERVRIAVHTPPNILRRDTKVSLPNWSGSRSIAYRRHC